MTTFLLIRHGRTELVGRALAGRQDIELDADGRRQAEELTHRLSRTHLDAIYSSPLVRASQTAQPLAKKLGLPVQIRPNLAEIDFGDWTGQTFNALETDKHWSQYNTFRSGARCPGGENILDVQRRVIEEFAQLREAHPEQTVAIFAHGELIRSAVVYFAGIPIDLMLRVQIQPASISAIALADWGVKILAVNDTGAFSTTEPRP